MEIAVLSDPHAHPAALDAVLRDARRQGIRDFICLGDLVGYNAMPRELIALVQQHGIPCVAGNHDLMALGRIDSKHCGPLGRRAIEWTRTALAPADRDFLAALPDVLAPAESILAVHSMLGDPMRRLLHPYQFRLERERLRELRPAVRFCLTGHTHRQEVWSVGEGGEVARHRGPTVPLASDCFYFINPGSVGHPRDGDARAAYGVLDLDRARVTFYRIPCDATAVQRANTRAGLTRPVPSRPIPAALAAMTGIAARLRRPAW